MDAPHRPAKRLLPVSLAALSLIVLAGPAEAASPTTYAGAKAASSLPATSADLDILPGPTAGGGSGRRVR